METVLLCFSGLQRAACMWHYLGLFQCEDLHILLSVLSSGATNFSRIHKMWTFPYLMAHSSKSPLSQEIVKFCQAYSRRARWKITRMGFVAQKEQGSNKDFLSTVQIGGYSWGKNLLKVTTVRISAVRINVLFPLGSFLLWYMWINLHDFSTQRYLSSASCRITSANFLCKQNMQIVYFLIPFKYFIY